MPYQPRDLTFDPFNIGDVYKGRGTFEKPLSLSRN
jgi:hypothetical protein